MTALELSLQFIFIILFFGLLASFIMWVSRILLDSKLMAKIAPYKIKKGTLVYYNDRPYEVLHHNKKKYNLKRLGSIEESILNVDRKDIKLANSLKMINTIHTDHER